MLNIIFRILCTMNVIKSRSIIDFIGFNRPCWSQIWSYFHFLIDQFYGFDVYLRMQYVQRAKYWGYSTKSLWYISNSIINIQIRAIPIYFTWFDKLSEPFQESLNSILFLSMLWDLLVVIILIVTNNIS